MSTVAPIQSRAAEADHPIHPLLAERWSPRAFAERPVAQHDLLSILEAARWAPSASNRQPWHFLVATKETPEAYQRLLQVLMEGNQRWAQAAPVLMLVVAKLNTDRDAATLHHSLFDAGLAAGLLTVQAGALGIAVHQMGGFHADKAHADLGVPDGYAPIAALALGYVGDAETLPEDLRARELGPRTRKPLPEFVFGPTWGEPLPALSR